MVTQRCAYVTQRGRLRFVMGAYEGLDAATRSRVTAAVERSFVGRLPENAKQTVLARARLVRFPAGRFIIDGRGGFAGITVSGVLRVFDATDSDDAGVTYRNVVHGETVGLGALIGEDDDIWVRAMTPSEVLSLDLNVAARLREADAPYSSALAREVFRRLIDTSREVRIWKRGFVRQRLVRQLLDIAAREPERLPIVVHVMHQELADAIGSRREAVTRALGRLEERGLIELGRERITILDLLGLRQALEER